MLFTYWAVDVEYTAPNIIDAFGIHLDHFSCSFLWTKTSGMLYLLFKLVVGETFRVYLAYIGFLLLSDYSLYFYALYNLGEDVFYIIDKVQRCTIFCNKIIYKMSVFEICIAHSVSFYVFPSFIDIYGQKLFASE